MSKLELYLSKIVKYGLYAILLTPLAFWPKALFPFLTPKFILFQILVEIVFGAWIIMKLDFKNWLVIALVLFFAISFVSALFGVDFSRSFWGLGARMTGLFAELHFLAWFLVLVSFLKNKEEWNRYINFSFVVALIVAATAFYQNPKWGLSFGYGIFNNPTFVAPYLIFHFFWGLYQALNLKSQISNLKKLWRWFFAAGAALLLFVILFAQIRGAVLGLLIGIFALGLGLILSDILSRRLRIILLTCYVLLIAGLVAFWQLRDNQFIQSFSPIRRVTGISLSETTVQTRLLTWRVALKGVKSAGWRTFFGTGPENFNYSFNKYYNPRFLKFGGGGFGETWFDKPHNAALEVLAETGIIGGLAYVLIWFAAVVSLFKLFKSGQKLLSIILISAFSAYLGTVFFSFDSFGSWFGLYLFLAFLASHNNANAEENIRMPRIANTIHSRLASFAITLAVFALLYVNYSIWRANVADADALRTFSQNPESGLALFEKSLSYKSPYKSEYQFDLVASVGGAAEKGLPIKNLEDTINFALDEADKAVAAHPQNAGSYTDMLRIYNILGTLGHDPEILAQAEQFGKKSLELSPNRQETLFYLTRTALLQNKSATAVEWAKQAVAADPAIGTGHWYLGLSLIADNQKTAGIIEIKKALELSYRLQNQKEKDFVKNLGL